MPKATLSGPRPSSGEAARALASLVAAFPQGLPSASSASSAFLFDANNLPKTLLDLLSSLAPSQHAVQPSHTMTLLSTVPGLLPDFALPPTNSAHVVLSTDESERRSNATYHPVPTRSGRVPAHQPTDEADRGMTLFNEYLNYDWPSDDEDDPDFTLMSDFPTPESHGESESDDDSPEASNVLVTSLRSHPNLPTPVASTSSHTLHSPSKLSEKRKSSSAAAKFHPASANATSPKKRQRARPSFPPLLPESLPIPFPELKTMTATKSLAQVRLERQRERNKGTAKTSRDRAKKKLEHDRERLAFLEKEHLELLERVMELERDLDAAGGGADDREESSSEEGASEVDEEECWDATSPAEGG